MIKKEMTVMKCPLCKKDIPDEGISPDRVRYCVFCGSPLLIMNEGMTALADYLTKKGVISSADDLTKTASITFRYVSDDGIIPLRQIEQSLVCPLFYTAKDVLNAMLRSKLLYTKSFHHIMDFYSYNSDLVVNHRNDELQRPDGHEVILAEALTIAKNNQLTLVYAHRDELMSRAGSFGCLYGCPVSSELEKKYAHAGQHSELIPLNE